MQEGAAADWQSLAGRRCVAEAVGALQAATGGRPGENGSAPPPALRRALPGPSYMYCFPILRAVMRWVWGGPRAAGAGAAWERGRVGGWHWRIGLLS